MKISLFTNLALAASASGASLRQRELLTTPTTVYNSRSEISLIPSDWNSGFQAVVQKFVDEQAPIYDPFPEAHTVSFVHEAANIDCSSYGGSATDGAANVTIDITTTNIAGFGTGITVASVDYEEDGIELNWKAPVGNELQHRLKFKGNMVVELQLPPVTASMEITPTGNYCGFDIVTAVLPIMFQGQTTFSGDVTVTGATADADIRTHGRVVAPNGNVRIFYQDVNAVAASIVHDQGNGIWGTNVATTGWPSTADQLVAVLSNGAHTTVGSYLGSNLETEIGEEITNVVASIAQIFKEDPLVKVDGTDFWGNAVHRWLDAPLMTTGEDTLN